MLTRRKVAAASIAAAMTLATAAPAASAPAVGDAASVGFSAAATLVVGGTTFPSMGQELMSRLTNTYSNVWVSVPYPAQLWPATDGMRLGESVTIGAGTLLPMITSSLETGMTLAVWGISQGALVIDAVQQMLADDPTAPPANSIVFIRVADPAQPGTGVLQFLPAVFLKGLLDYTDLARVAPQSQYNTVTIVNAFDGFADFPDRPNLAAIANALAGLLYRHGQTATVNLADVPSENITVEVNHLGGVMTTYLAPASFLPLTQPLRDAGLPAAFVDALDAQLWPKVKAGYSRYDAPAPNAATSLTAPQANPGPGSGDAPEHVDGSVPSPSQEAAGLPARRVLEEAAPASSMTTTPLEVSTLAALPATDVEPSPSPTAVESWADHPPAADEAIVDPVAPEVDSRQGAGRSSQRLGASVPASRPGAEGTARGRAAQSSRG